MIYIVLALSSEARPLFTHFGLKRNNDLPYPLYTDGTKLLIVTQPGYENALMATSTLLGYRTPEAEDTLLNIGICAAPKSHAIGALLLAHKISHGTHDYYPDILFRHPNEETDLRTVADALSSPEPVPVDMEAHAIYKAGSRFFKAHQMAFLKIVSDHFEPERVTKELAFKLLQDNIPAIEQIMRSMEYVVTAKTLFTDDERRQISAIKAILTKSQASAFDDACHYHRLKHNTPFPELFFTLPTTHHKKERRDYFDRLVQTLTL